MYKYKRGDGVPKSVAFMVRVKADHVATYSKGDVIQIDDIDHIIGSINKIEFKGGFVQVIGKCKIKNWG